MEEQTRKPIYANYTIWLLILAVVFIIAFSTLPSVAFYYKENTTISEWGQLGDALNIAGTVLNAATLVFLALTFLSQKESFKTQQDAFAKQEDELKEQRKMMQAQQEVMKQQLAEMQTSRTLESARILHTQIMQMIANFQYSGGFQSGSTYTTKIVGYNAFSKMITDIQGSIENDRNIGTNKDYITQLKPILKSIMAFCNISQSDTAQILMLRAIIPDGFQNLCFNLTGSSTENKNLSFLRDTQIRNFRELIDQIPKEKWN